MNSRKYAYILLATLLAVTVLLAGCGKKEPPAPTPTPAPPPAHGHPEGDVTGDTKLEILEKLETNHDLLYIFEVTSRSKEIARVFGSTYDSALILDAEGYVRGSGDEGFAKLTVEHLDERVYWKLPGIYRRVETDALGQKGSDTFNPVKRQNSPQHRLIKAVHLPSQLAILKQNVDQLEMNIAGDNVYFALSDTAAKDLKGLLQPQVDFVYYISSQGGIISDSMNLLDTREMLLEWVFNLSEQRPLEMVCQARSGISYVGMRADLEISTHFKYGLVTNPELPPPEKINWE